MYFDTLKKDEWNVAEKTFTDVQLKIVNLRGAKTIYKEAHLENKRLVNEMDKIVDKLKDTCIVQQILEERFGEKLDD